MSPASLDFETDVVKITEPVPEYEGDYTVTPSETAQTLLTDGKKMTDDVTVSAIPSDYVGSGVTQRDSADLSASGDTVTVPAGYYAASASKAVDAATWKTASTVGTVPAITVSSSGLITATDSGWTSIHPLTASGWADKDTAANIQLAGVKTKQLDTLGATTYTPSQSTQTINAGVYLTGAQTINPIPSNYYDMSDPMSFLGKGATCINASAYSSTFALKDTAWHGWTPTTSAQVLIASAAAGTFTATDMANNEYFLVWECGVDPVYGASATNKALAVESKGIIIQELCRRPSSVANIGSANFNSNVCVTSNSSSALIYYNSSGTLTMTWSASYGFYFGAAAATYNSSSSDNPTVTIKTPTLSARCSTTYLSTANAGYINEDDSKGFIKGKIYRITRNGEFRSVYEMLVSLFNE